jgi:hypothetical protein
LSKNKFSFSWAFFAFLAAALSVWLGSTSAALAAGTTGASGAATFGDMLCQAFLNSKPFFKVFQEVAYASGVFSMLRGIYGLRLHSENPVSNKLSTPLMYLAGSALLLALPEAVGTIQGSLIVPSGAGLVTCAAGAPSTSQELDLMMAGFISNIKNPLMEVSSVVAILAGMFMIVHGLMKASKYGTDPKVHSMHSILTNLGFGAVLMAIGDNLEMMLASIFGTNTITAPSSLTWSGLTQLTQGATAQFHIVVAAALTFVQLIGIIAFIRGWLMMKKFMDGGNVSFAQALTHILGGCIAVNVAAFLEIMDKTFGTNLM